MSTEELLKSRVKVIAPYPNSPYKVGEILTEFFFDNGNSYFSVNDENGFHDKVISSVTINECPNIFIKMEWWEDRKIEDMPEYVKLDPNHYDDYHGSNKEGILKVFAWDEGFAYLNPENDEDFIDNTNLHFIPSTKEEYEQYLKTKQQ